jgi:hypothetical protein
MAEVFQQDIVWRKSSYSAGDGECVEIALADSCVWVRDSKHRKDLILSSDINSWLSLIKSIKTDPIDLTSPALSRPSDP